MPFLLAISEWILSAGGTLIAGTAVRFMAFKAMGLTLLVTVLPIVAKNFVVWFMNFAMDIIAEQTANLPSDGIQSAVIELTGLGAYLAQACSLPTCFTIIMTGLSVRLALNFIPFVG